MNILGFHLAFVDVVQVAILYILIYWLLRSARGSTFVQMLMGVLLIALVLVGLTRLAHLEVISKLFGYLLIYLAVSSVVIFQPEIRRILPAIGSFAIFKRARFDDAADVTPERLTACVMALAKKKIGALIAIEHGISLRSFMETGIPLDAIVTPEILLSIFTPPLPMHDGGLVIHRGRIAAAHCVFPVSSQPSLNTSGMRHRAAVGLSEETDALVIVVSEETGCVSVAHNGVLHRYPYSSMERVLNKWFTKAMSREKDSDGSLAGWLDSKAKSLVATLERRRKKQPEDSAPEKDNVAAIDEKESK